METKENEDLEFVGEIQHSRRLIQARMDRLLKRLAEDENLKRLLIQSRFKTHEMPTRQAAQRGAFGQSSSGNERKLVSKSVGHIPYHGKFKKIPVAEGDKPATSSWMSFRKKQEPSLDRTLDSGRLPMSKLRVQLAWSRVIELDELIGNIDPALGVRGTRTFIEGTSLESIRRVNDDINVNLRRKMSSGSGNSSTAYCRSHVWFYPNRPLIRMRTRLVPVLGGKSSEFIPEISKDANNHELFATLHFSFTDVDLYNLTKEDGSSWTEWEYFEFLDSLPCPPDVRVRSGGEGGLHLYWSFASIALEGLDDEGYAQAIARWKTLQESIKLAVHGDKNFNGTVLRVPRTTNYKPGREARPCDYVEGSRLLEDARKYPKYGFEQLCSAFEIDGPKIRKKQDKPVTSNTEREANLAVRAKYAQGFDSAWQRLAPLLPLSIKPRRREIVVHVLREVWTNRSRKNFTLQGIVQTLGRYSGTDIKIAKDAVLQMKTPAGAQLIEKIAEYQRPFKNKKGRKEVFRLGMGFKEMLGDIMSVSTDGGVKSKELDVERFFSDYYRAGERTDHLNRDAIKLAALGKTEAEAVELLVQKAKRSATIPGGSTSGTRGIRNAVRSGYAYQRRKKLANF